MTRVLNNSAVCQARPGFTAFAVMALAMAVLGTSVAWAHDPGLSVATARLAEGTLSIHLTLARSDVEGLVTLDADRDGTITDPKFQAALPQLRRKALEAFAVSCEGQQLPTTKATIARDNRDGLHFDLVFTGVAAKHLTIRSGLLDELPRGHRQFLSLRDEKNGRLGEQMLDAAHNSLAVNVAGHPLPISDPQSFRKFLRLGIEHIATGYDHLLFLLGLLLVGGTVRSALKIITSFTLAHSLTLALATLNLIDISPKIIEPLIAASIIYVGAENILRRGVENRWMLTFGFGLIHGCGFASALRELGIGANGSSIAVPLLSFNTGVELGQLAIAGLVLPFVWKCRSSPVFVHRLVPVGSGLIVMAGGYWLLERTVL